MAIGDTFEDLSLEDEETPEEKALKQEQRKRQGKSLAAMTPQRLKEQAYLAKVEAEQQAEQERIARFGTADPMTAAKVAATGAFEGDLAQRMAIDPDGTKAAVEQAAAILGRGGASDAPTGEPEGPPAPGRKYSRGVGAHGEPYFTNLTPDELQEERHQTERILGERGDAPVRDLKRIPGMQDQPAAPGGKRAPSTAAEILFEGRLEQARTVTSKPDVEMAQLQKSTELFNELWEEPSIAKARQKLEDMLTGGALRKRGVLAKTASAVDKALVKRAKTVQEFAEDPSIDRMFYKPWHDDDEKPGLAADPSQPATLLNPGGRMPDGDVVQATYEQAQKERARVIEESMPKELPRTAQIAARKGSATAERLKAKAVESRATRKKKQREEFGFEYEPPSIAGLFGFGE